MNKFIFYIMQKVLITTEKYREWVKGDIIEVHNNEAHALVDRGWGRIYIEPLEDMESPVYEAPETVEKAVVAEEKPKDVEVVNLGNYFKCDICGKTYSREAYYKRHMRAHERNKEMTAEDTKGYKTK